ncbi:glycosyl hydrolase [Sphingobium estronivorans]|uniref:glycosyl hydrolase n=1 Tax=Sphingobium estronivorans TaxID=1577690 RepID=UPI0013C2E68C|nr:glycosyl hydrolase [Sphingobium estronivorans]
MMMNIEYKQDRIGPARRFFSIAMLFGLWFAPLPAIARDGARPDRIEQPEKIGVGTWPLHGEARMIRDIDRLGARWFYSWTKRAPQSDRRFVPMHWGRQDSAGQTHAVMLAFNEPDEPKQAAMTVEEALAQWPRLMAAARRLSSPATSREQTLGAQSWLGRFMAEAERRSYRVDFIAVHYYTQDPDIGLFKRFLEQVHAQYGRPVWVTEWALADWDRPDRFSAAQQQAFFEGAVQMMDDLDFVERHAWFGTYAGLDNLDLGSALLTRDGRLTPLGDAFRAAAQGSLKGPECVSEPKDAASGSVSPAPC